MTLVISCEGVWLCVRGLTRASLIRACLASGGSRMDTENRPTQPRESPPGPGASAPCSRVDRCELSEGVDWGGVERRWWVWDVWQRCERLIERSVNGSPVGARMGRRVAVRLLRTGDQPLVRATGGGIAPRRDPAGPVGQSTGHYGQFHGRGHGDRVFGTGDGGIH
jgi:hypothetical protein